MKCDDWSSGRKGCPGACRTKKTKFILNFINDLRVKSMIRVDWSSGRKRCPDAYRTIKMSILALTNDLRAKSMKRDDYVGY
jgi:hypothetical protein